MTCMTYLLFYDQAVDLHFPPHYRDVYLEKLPREGDRVRGLFFCREPGSEQAIQLKSAGHVVLGKQRPWGIIGRWRYSRRFGNAFRQMITDSIASTSDPITIIVHDDPWAARVALRARRKHGDRIRVIYRIGNLKPEGLLRLSRNRMVHAMAKTAARWRDRMIGEADATIFMSDEMRRYLVEDRGVSPVRDAVIPSLVDCRAVSKALEEPDEQDVESLRLQLGTGSRWIVYAGDVSRGRNMPFLLDMLEVMREDCPDVGLLVLGNYPDPAYREDLLAQASVRLPGVPMHLVGPFQPRSYYQALHLADLAVNPFPPVGDHLTNSPVKCVDYQAVGLPTIATHIPDHEMVLGATGCGTTCDYEATAFAAACREWLGRTDAGSDAARSWIVEHRDLAVAVDTIRSLALDRGPGT